MLKYIDVKKNRKWTMGFHGLIFCPQFNITNYMLRTLLFNIIIKAN